MTKLKLMAFGCLSVVSLLLPAVALADDQPAESVPLEKAQEMKEMPVLTGDQWQTFSQESKLAFVWGIGHVVTVEQHVVERHPELKREDFTEKLSEGLKGIPMVAIVQQIDDFYRYNPEDADLPVMRVIWRQIVKPKLTTGIAGRPLQDNEH
ncbi:hypothetical protein L4X63_10080 [Geomonas sp. Red32]|uniref:hypothetical protein n=1 Tax=Geomonas sp. Red32 TaxID=2912856 RepID=UPI00202D09BC|nr:hypothetical protein [Geomonas sp. Red32]MCM0081938.1 hypothetical protein [Geomonas sp. Red32]